ncbi:hypothetical protein RJ55_04107 [Drechmeria coniospora]|nr:hypothetical protein RJ55_04107 [Drechmeria coniospora]
MTALLSLALLCASTVSSAPTPEPADANQIDAKRRFYCPSRVQAFCSASNIRSGCTANGEFRSNAMDTCRECKC